MDSKDIDQNPKSLEVSFEVKAILDEDDGFFRFEGLASTFGNVDHGGDVVMPGAFTKSLESVVPIILWQHKHGEPIGMPEQIMETSEGLFIRARLPLDDSLVKGRVVPQVKVGSIRKMSIGYKIRPGGALINSNGVRELHELDLFEISLITFPMNPEAEVTGFKSLSVLENLDISDEKKEQIKAHIENKQITVEDLKFLDDETVLDRRAFENVLRESGLFSKNAAIKLSSYYRLSESDEDKGSDDSLLAELKSMKDAFDEAEIKSQIKNMLNKLED